MSAEIIDQANELAERRLEMTIQNMRINHTAVSATHCRDCGEEIPERRRELVAGGWRRPDRRTEGLSSHPTPPPRRGGVEIGWRGAVHKKNIKGQS